MTLGDAIRKAVQTRDPIVAAGIVDMAAAKGLTHAQIWRMVNNVQPISPAEWDELLYEADRQLSQG